MYAGFFYVFQSSFRVSDVRLGWVSESRTPEEAMNLKISFLFDFNTLFETHYIMNEWIVPMILHKHV